MKLSTLMAGCTALAALLPFSSMALNPSPGCYNNQSQLTSSGTYTLTHKGIERTYRVHVPNGYSTTSPSKMVTLFHGWSGDENEFLSSRSVTREADQRGYVLVAARGLGSGEPDNSYNSWTFRGSSTGLDGDGGNGINGAICDYNQTAEYTYPSCAATASNSCSWTQCQQSDVEFVAALVEHLFGQMCVDTDNVFASGGSNGGMFTWELGQNATTAPLFRALAPIIGLPHRGYLDGPAKQGDMPVILITGTRDPTVPPGDWNDDSYTTTTDGDFFYYSGATAITKSWADAQGCDVSGSAQAFDTPYRKADCRTYCTGGQGWPTVLDCRSNMAHTYSFGWSWKLVMDFFDNHSL